MDYSVYSSLSSSSIRRTSHLKCEVFTKKAFLRWDNFNFLTKTIPYWRPWQKFFWIDLILQLDIYMIIVYIFQYDFFDKMNRSVSRGISWIWKKNRVFIEILAIFHTHVSPRSSQTIHLIKLKFYLNVYNYDTYNILKFQYDTFFTVVARAFTSNMKTRFS